MRIGGPIRAWARGETLATTEPLDPQELLRLYARVRSAVIRSGCPAARGPFPDDLREPLLLAHSFTAARGGREDR